jgi:hypothetical protein
MVLKLFCFTCTIKKIVEYETLFGSGINSNMNPNFFFFFIKKKKNVIMDGMDVLIFYRV